MCSRLVYLDISLREKILKFYGWGLLREKRGKGEGKQCDVCAVNSKLGGSTVFHIPKQLPGSALCVKARSGNDYPRCLHFVKLCLMDLTGNAIMHDFFVFFLWSRAK